MTLEARGPEHFDARVTATRMLTRGVRELAFERTDGTAMTFEPGQWVNLMLPGGADGKPMKRSYSIASAPDGSPRFELAVTRVEEGPASSWLHAVRPGAVVRVVGPAGFFVRPAASSAPSLMIATGTGLTPIRSMVHAALAARSCAPLWILLGVRQEEDVLYADELAELAAKHPFLRVETTLSRPGKAWTGRSGYVQAHVPELWAELTGASSEAPHAFVCGLGSMLTSVRDVLRKDLAVPRLQVHTERFD